MDWFEYLRAIVLILWLMWLGCLGLKVIKDCREDLRKAQRKSHRIAIVSVLICGFALLLTSACTILILIWGIITIF